MAVTFGRFILSLLSFSCCHPLLPLCLHNSDHRVVDCHKRKFAFTLVTICPRPPSDVVCQMRSFTPLYLTPVLSCGRARCDYNLIETNTLYFQVWTRPKFTSPSDLNLPLSFLNPDCSHADLQPRTLEQLFSVSSDAASGGRILCCSNHTGNRDLNSKPL